MTKKSIEEYLLESKKDMIVELDLAYTLSVHKGIITNEDRINQVAYTLLNTCLRLHKQTKAVGIDHVRIKVGDKGPGKPKEVLGDNYTRVMSVCAIILRTSEDIPVENLQEQFGLAKNEIWCSVPELTTRDGHAYFKPHTPIRQLVKRLSAFNSGELKI